MTGPSASGSEKGTPISSTSAPARSRATRISAERGRSGSPAVVYVTSPARPSRRIPSKRSASRDMTLLAGDRTEMLLHGVHVLVAAPGQVDEDRGRPSELRGEAPPVRDGVRGLE